MWNTRIKSTQRGTLLILFMILISNLFIGCSKKKEDATYNTTMLETVTEKETSVLIQEVQESETKKYQAQKLTKGDISIEITNKGILYYPKKEKILFQEDRLVATVVEVNTALSNVVEEGDKLIRVKYSIDPITLEKKKLEVKRNKENIAYTKEDYDDELEQLKSDIAKELDKSKQTIRKADYDKRKQEIKDILDQMEEDYQALYNEALDYEQKAEVSYITAPITGKITELEKIKVGDVLSPHQYIGSIDDLSEVYLAIENESGQFRYNMEVEVKTTEQGNTKESKTTKYKGVIITGNELVSKELATPMTYIKLLDGELKDLENKTILVNGKTKHLKNMLLVDKSSVNFDKRISFVYEQQGETWFKRNFLIGTSDSYNYCVVDGLYEGMDVLLGVSK